jgi:hypothetical protein
MLEQSGRGTFASLGLQPQVHMGGISVPRSYLDFLFLTTTGFCRYDIVNSPRTESFTCPFQVRQRVCKNFTIRSSTDGYRSCALSLASIFHTGGRLLSVSLLLRWVRAGRNQVFYAHPSTDVIAIMRCLATCRVSSLLTQNVKRIVAHSLRYRHFGHISNIQATRS